MAITLTESAASEAKKYIESAGPESFLRIRLVAGGCSGHNSSLQIDKTYDEKADSKFDFFGVPVVVDKKSELYLEDAKLDFITFTRSRAIVSSICIPALRAARTANAVTS